MALALHVACSSETSAPSCADTCGPANSSACADGKVSACVAGPAGCLAWAPPVSCASSSCDSAGVRCNGCLGECSLGTTECASGVLRTCGLGTDGCPRWSPTPCPAICADATHCANCANECTSGTTSCEAGQFASCYQGAEGCWVWSARTACPSGSCASATSCTGSCNPDCAGKTCGDDGCGGTCGSCDAPQVCTSRSQCVTPCTAGADECTDATHYHVCGPDPAEPGVTSYGFSIPCEPGNVCNGGNCSGHCTTPEIMLVLDRSSSMMGARWDFVETTMMDFVLDEQEYVRFGLQTFPSSGACAVAGTVLPAPNNYGAVSGGLLAPTSDAQTPIAAALQSLGTAYGDPNEAQYAVLISDGSETCASSGAEAVTAAGELARKGVDTFVIAVSTDADTALLDQIASAGRTGASYRVATATQLSAALYEIFGLTRSCACGDGVRQSNEVCDDGNRDDLDYCSWDCQHVIGRCGDATKQTNEACDDGHTTACGACNATCTGPGTGSVCGDSVVCADTEACDDGNTDAGDYCAADCKTVTGRCGDKIVQTNETCDDGNTLNGDYCSSDCKSVTASCGDGIKQWNEACDDGNTDAGDYCAADCLHVTGRCGDGITQANEACDDGNTAAGDYCAADCKSITGWCGDHIVQSNETCDDGYTTECGECNATCTGPGSGSTCGDGLLCPDTEFCDDGYNTECGPCNATCTDLGSGSICGDSAVCPDTEVCDDGNTDGADYCSADCTSTGRCGDGITQASVEACDDGNTAAGDYCSADCTSVTGSCGDWVKQSIEVCDLPNPNCVSCSVLPALTVGGHSSCALRATGEMKCWGYDIDGQLGLGDTANRGDGSGEMGANLPVVSLGTGRVALAIEAGDSHACAILDDGSVKCWGLGYFGELGLGDTANRGDGPGEMGDDLPAVSLGTGRTAFAITAGASHTCALLDDGSVKCWGSNSAGELGVGDTARRGDGPNEMGDSLPAVDLGAGRSVLTIAAGGGHTCALLDDGSVKCWGFNNNGQLGLGDTSARGDAPGEMGDALPAVNLGAGRTAVAIAAGSKHTCAILDDGTLKCWGLNSAGELGLGDTANRGDASGEMGDNLPAVSLGTGRTAVAVAAGAGHTCAILDNRSLKCWGTSWYGELGLGARPPVGDGPGEMGDSLAAVKLGTGRTAASIRAGANHNCAMLDNGSVKCWGYNLYGELGLGNTNTPSMGDQLPAVNIWGP